MQCRSLGIEIQFCDGDGQGDAFAVGGRASGGGLRGHFADGGAAEEVPRADQVVGEIHVFGVLWEEAHAAGGVAVEGLAEETHGLLWWWWWWWGWVYVTVLRVISQGEGGGFSRRKVS